MIASSNEKDAVTANGVVRFVANAILDAAKG